MKALKNSEFLVFPVLGAAVWQKDTGSTVKARQEAVYANGDYAVRSLVKWGLLNVYHETDNLCEKSIC